MSGRTRGALTSAHALLVSPVMVTSTQSEQTETEDKAGRNDQGASARGALFIIGLISCCCCARKGKKNKKADQQKVAKMKSTVSQYGENRESSESSEDGDAA